MTRLLSALCLSSAVAVLLTACAPATAAPTLSPSASAVSPSAARAVSPSAAAAPSPSTAPAGPAPRARYDWGVPSSQVTVQHDVQLPVILVEVRSGDNQDQGYSRVTFAFRGAYPAYHFGYVAQVVHDGSGNPISLPGNSFLSIVFHPAEAHDSAGSPTVPNGLQHPGYRHLSSYQQAGDYEGYVTYGLGITSDHRLQIRVGELQRPDGTYVVTVDVRNI